MSVLTPARALARIRGICLALPDTTEKEAWGAPTFRVRDKLFVMFVNDHHGDGRLAIWCAAASGAQAAIVDADARRFFVPPYVGKGGWIGIRLDRRPNWAVVAALVEEGYRTVAARGRTTGRPKAGKRRASRPLDTGRTRARPQPTRRRTSIVRSSWHGPVPANSRTSARQARSMSAALPSRTLPAARPRRSNP